MQILAIDQGTTSTRALRMDASGRLRPVLSLTHRQFYPAAGHVEHDPEELLANVVRCLAAAEGARLAGIDNQGESCLAWDAEDGKAISPVIVWQDDRTADVTAALEADGVGPEVMARAGLPLDPYFSASKLGWIVRNIPRARELAALGRLRLSTTDAFFRDRLTGRFETDVATASRTSLMNLETCEWDEELCRIFGVPIEALPPIGPTCGNLGPLPHGLRLGASIVDQQAALYGHGCRNPGEAKITFGTGAFAQCVTGTLKRPEKPGPLPTVGWQRPGEAVTYALDGGVYAAAAAVNWACDLGLFGDYGEIGAFEASSAIDRGIAFVPALSGIGCPHWSRQARGGWLGLGLATGKGDMMQALLEGIALRSAEVLISMEAEQSFAGAVSVDGGLSRNGYFTQFLADVTGRDLFVSAEPELTAAGLARMAAEGAGIDLPEVREGTVVAASGALHADMRRRRFEAALKAVEGYARASG
ncbi:Glycerol kinase [Hartmannibacter diazotrophicus]|uniref:ATP:glycerol 3-phosphotransferase n=1 Tax=Hartmannibacter diazotrophicus TaxID=1482074 RepID=A0A2C9DBG2_9HYPH|nr:FGGY family carbohydrate kinase [Hartmannibacter diazotrophicus]SON57573.1 Glycerol kinase [Hartmannibacter diazotrophicus]